MKALYHRLYKFEDLLAFFQGHTLEDIYFQVAKSIYMYKSNHYRDKPMEEYNLSVIRSPQEHCGQFSVCTAGTCLDFIHSFDKRMADYIKVYEMLEDDFSRQTYTNLLLYRLLPSVHDYGKAVKVEGLQYFRKEIIPECKNGTYVDCGCFDGETVEQFIEVYGEDYKSIHFFEPIPTQYENCVARTKERKNIIPHPLATGKEKGEVFFSDNGFSSSSSGKGEFRVELVALDDIISEPISFLKMDIEGAEMDGIQGARQHIKNDKPIMTLCLYHLLEDLIDIPLALADIDPNYRFHMRYHAFENSTYALEIVLYAVPAPEKNLKVVEKTGTLPLYHRLKNFQDILDLFQEKSYEEICEESFLSTAMYPSLYYRDLPMERYNICIRRSLEEEFEVYLCYGAFNPLSFIRSFQGRMADYVKVYEMLEDDFSRQTYFYMLMFRLIPTAFFYLEEVDLKGSQYFRTELIPEHKNGVYVDCGCYDGGTVHDFMTAYGEDYKAIYFFEPLPLQYKTCCVNTKNLKNIFSYQEGVGKEKGSFYFQEAGDSSCLSDSGNIKIQVDTLDSKVKEPITFLKMDIEGAEMDALRGAERHLREDKPINAICVYHLLEDLIDIPLYLENINPNQRFHLRKYNDLIKTNPFEIVFYTVPKES